MHRRRHSLFGTWNKVPGQKDDDDQVYHCARPLAVEKHYPKYNDPTAGRVSKVCLIVEANYLQKNYPDVVPHQDFQYEDETTDQDEYEKAETITSDEETNTNNNTNAIHYPKASRLEHFTCSSWLIFSAENTDYLSSTSQNSPGDVIVNLVNSIKRSIGRKLPATPLKSPFSNELIETFVPSDKR